MYTYNIHTYYADKIKMCLCHILVGKKLSKFNVRKDESLPHKPLATPHSSQSSPAPAGRRRGGYGFAVGTRTQSTRRTGGSSCGGEGGGPGQRSAGRSRSRGSVRQHCPSTTHQHSRKRGFRIFKTSIIFKTLKHNAKTPLKMSVKIIYTNQKFCLKTSPPTHSHEEGSRRE